MATDTWTLDPTHSAFNFTVRHMVISKVRGNFGKFAVELKLDPTNLATASATATVETASISTGVGDRDHHLRSPDFFDAAGHPALTFVSRKVEVVSKEAFTLTGDLTIRGTTRPITLAGEFGGTAKDPWGGLRAGFALKGSLNRKDYGLTWNQALETGGVLVSEHVDLDVELEFIKKS
jgi:polyisoprenoid-binding protein YceI